MPGGGPEDYGYGYEDTPHSKRILSQIGTRARQAAPIFGAAAGSQAAGNRADTNQQMDYDQLQLQRYRTGLEAPRQRMNTAVQASRIMNRVPVQAKWGGPGSGLRGEIVQFGPGFGPRDPRVNKLADDIISQQLEQQGVTPVGADTVDPESGNSVNSVAGRIAGISRLTGGNADQEAIAAKLLPIINQNRRNNPERGGPPIIQKPKKPGVGDKILGGIATGAGIAGAFL